jgi:hypothetical protein
MSRAKGRIADELLIQYDVYLEKYREYSSCMQIFQFLRTQNAEAHGVMVHGARNTYRLTLT